MNLPVSLLDTNMIRSILVFLCKTVCLPKVILNSMRTMLNIFKFCIVALLMSDFSLLIKTTVNKWCTVSSVAIWPPAFSEAVFVLSLGYSCVEGARPDRAETRLQSTQTLVISRATTSNANSANRHYGYNQR